MTSSSLLTIGTPLGDWEAPILPLGSGGGGLNLDALGPGFQRLHEDVDTALAQMRDWATGATAPPATTAWRVGPAAPAEAAGAIHVDERGVWALDALEVAWPDARYLIVVQGPATTVAAWLARGGSAPLDDVLTVWRFAARRLLRHALSQPARSLMVLADDGWPMFAGLAAVCRQRLKVELPSVAASAETPGRDPLLAALASAQVAADRETCRLFDELAASCMPLPGAGPGIAGWTSSPWAPAVARLRSLQQAQREAQALPAQVMAAQREALQARACADETAKHLALMQDELDANQRERLRAEAQAAQLAEVAQAAKQSHSLLEQQVQQLQEELETHFLERRRVEAQSVAQAAQTAQAAQAAKQSQSLLERQVQQLQEELEQYYLTLTQMQASSGEAMAEGPALKLPRVSLSNVREEGPHRECAFLLDGVQHGDRVLGRLELRLVEHHGRAGLVLMDRERDPPPLDSWLESGREGHRGYMLLIPTDTNTHGRIKGLSGRDWQLVLALAARLQPIAQDLTPSLRWPMVAARLRQELIGMPLTLHCDAVHVEPALSPPSASSLALAFDNAVCGVRPLGELRLRWSLAPAQIELARPESPGTLLHWPSWPLDEAGRPAAGLCLPVGRHGRDAWRLLSQADRDLALALLDSLPALVSGLPANALPAGSTQASLLQAARSVVRDGRRMFQVSPVRQVARGLLGRPPAPQ